MSNWVCGHCRQQNTAHNNICAHGHCAGLHPTTMSWISPQVGYLHLWLQVEAKGCFGGRSLKWQLLGVIRDGVLRQDDKDYQGGSIWGAGCTSHHTPLLHTIHYSKRPRPPTGPGARRPVCGHHCTPDHAPPHTVLPPPANAQPSAHYPRNN